MREGLFEALSGKFMDGTPVDAVPVSQRPVRSILDNLRRVLDTRAGSLVHMPDYGLPDLSGVYRSLPLGAETLRAAVASAMERYEPRLRDVRVIPLESKSYTGRLAFLVTAQLAAGGQIRLQATFSSAEGTSLTPWRGTS
jgi:type VI secretion system protein